MSRLNFKSRISLTQSALRQEKQPACTVNKQETMWFLWIEGDFQKYQLTFRPSDSLVVRVFGVCVRMGQKGNKTTDFTTSLHSARPGKSKSSYHTLSTNIVASLMFGTWAAGVGRWLDETLCQSHSRSLLHFALPFHSFKWSSGIPIGSKGNNSCVLWVVILSECLVKRFGNETKTSNQERHLAVLWFILMSNYNPVHSEKTAAASSHQTASAAASLQVLWEFSMSNVGLLAVNLLANANYY